MKPMLAATVKDTATLPYPLIASPKLDGVRALVMGGVVYSRSLKPIRNGNVQRLFGRVEFNGFDGELIVGDPTAPDVYRTTSSVVNSQDKSADAVKFYVFDDFCNPDWQYTSRMERERRYPTARVEVLDGVRVYNEEALLRYEDKLLADGYEGVMLRRPDAPYKFGRSTLREAYLMKLKRFSDSEAEILGFVERMHNGNEAQTNELGHTFRSSAKDGLAGMDTLGALIVRDIHTGVQFEIGTGFDDAMRAEIWRDKPLGALVKYKYFAVGAYDKPRFPVFLGFRSAEDM